MKIKDQLLLTHGLLVILALAIVFINVMAYKGMEHDADIINQAGKMRMLSYRMAEISSQIISQEDEVNSQMLVDKLMSSAKEFENIVDYLDDEGKKSGSVVSHPGELAAMEGIKQQWLNVFKPAYKNISVNPSAIDAEKQINAHIDTYVQTINALVTAYSAYSREKVIRAMASNGGLVFIIVLVTIYSFLSTNKRIRMPMKALMQELKDLSLIDDEVSKRLKNINSDEIAEMSEYFNEMIYDHLTRAFNRRAGLSKLSRILKHENRRNLKLSLCFMDINGLKEVNDHLGHRYGDELIVSAVNSLREEIRDEDFIVRMGGDEFLIVFNGIDHDLAEIVWGRVNQRYGYINEHERRPYLISVSHGIVDFDNTGKSEVEGLIKDADDKMYEEKKYIKEELKIKVIRTNIQ